MKIIIQLILTLTIGGSAVVFSLQFLRFLLPKGTNKWLYRIGKIAIFLYLVPIAILLQWMLTKYISVFDRRTFLSDSVFISNLSTNVSEFSVSMPIVIWSFVVWGLGIIVFAGWHTHQYLTFRRVLQATQENVPEDSELMQLFTCMKANLHIKSRVKLKYNRAIRSPFLIGLWNPVIYLPKYYDEETNLAMILHHELIHLKRKDVWVKTIALVASVIHWFNPFVYLLRKNIHQWSELTCDEEVVKDMSKKERKQYGETIINVMIRTNELPVQFCSSLSDEGKQLKRRLNNMLHVKLMKKSTILSSVVATVVIGLIGTSTAVWASGKTPSVMNPTEHESVVIEEDVNEVYTSSEEMVEVEWTVESEATKEQLETHNRALDATDADSDFWADVEEDNVIMNEDASKINIKDEVELEAGVFTEVE